MKSTEMLAGAVVVGGGLYLLSRPGVSLGPFSGTPTGSVPNTTGLPTNPAFTPAQQLALDQLAAKGPGNAPAVAGTPFLGTVQGASAVDSAIVTGSGLALGAIGLTGAALGVTTLGIGLAVTFFTYEYFAQQASIAANRWRDAWQKQFIALSNALGIDPLTHAGAGGYSTGIDGTSNGNIEMSRVIFFFDHDSTGRLWSAVTKTQNLATIQVAARAIDTFLKGQGVPVQGP